MNNLIPVVNNAANDDISNFQSNIANILRNKISNAFDNKRIEISKTIISIPMSNICAKVIPVNDIPEHYINEKITKSTSVDEIISDFVNSDDPKFQGKSRKERINMALGLYYSMHPEKSK